MSQRITKAYELSDTEQKIVTDKFAVHADWGKACFNGIKSNIKKHLRKEQNNKCCYCKQELGTDLKAVDIDHIIAKSIRVDFTFEPINLALSCPACNTIKGDKNIIKKDRKNYPKNGDAFSIIHAHFDDYSEHIKIDKCLYIPHTEKGSHTITICGLYRLSKVEKIAKELNVEKNKFTKLIEEIRTIPDVDLKELSSLSLTISEKINEIVQKK